MNGAPPPLLIFDTNILMDVLLGRDGAAAVLLVDLAEQHAVEIVVPEYVLFEFRGTAMRWVRDQHQKLADARRSVNEWLRCDELDQPADIAKTALKDVENHLEAVVEKVEVVIERVRGVARVPKHTLDLHFRGDLRYLSGRPPDRPVDGLKDCRIFEAVLDVVAGDQDNQRPRYLLTKDSDFDDPGLIAELRLHGVELHKSPGALYGKLRSPQ